MLEVNMTNEEKKKNVKDIFNITAEKYVEYFGDDWEFIDEINSFIQSTPSNGAVLDLGCGGGYITNYLANNGLIPVGIDFSEKMIKIAKEKYPHLKFLNMDLMDINNSFDENSIDGLIAIYTLYFIPRDNLDFVLSSLSRILKDGGKMLLVTQCGIGEQFVDESLMPDGKGEKSLFVSLHTEVEIREALERHNLVVDSMEVKENIDPDEISGSGRIIATVTNQKTLVHKM